MKKLIMLILMVFSIALSGCSKENNEDKPSENYHGIILTSELSYSLNTTGIKAFYTGSHTIEFVNDSLKKINKPNEKLIEALTKILNSSRIYKSEGRDGRGSQPILLCAYDDDPNKNNLIFYDYGYQEAMIIDRIEETYLVELMEYKDKNDYDIIISMNEATYKQFKDLFTL